MKTYITHNSMVEALVTDEWANWTYEGADALVNYLEELEMELDMDLDFDRVALRCEWTEHGSIESAMESYGIEGPESNLRHNTTVIDCPNGHVIVEDF